MTNQIYNENKNFPLQWLQCLNTSLRSCSMVTLSQLESWCRSSPAPRCSRTCPTSPRSLLPEHTLVWPGNTQALGIHLAWNKPSTPPKELPPFPHRTTLGVSHRQQNLGSAGWSLLLPSLLLGDLTFQGQKHSERENYPKIFQTSTEKIWMNWLVQTSVLRQLIAPCSLPEICFFFLLPCCYKASVKDVFLVSR